jgi:DNA-binding HxlR family transcriptional regulator
VSMVSELAPETFRSDGTRVCSIADALAILGDRWSLLVVREIDLGVNRFNDIQLRTGAPRQILTARLRKLEETGVLKRQQYSTAPPRFEYVLTPDGARLRPVLTQLRLWGQAHEATSETLTSA